MAAPRPIVHVPLLAAASAGLYAVSLSAIALLQAQHDGQVLASRQPLVDAAARAAEERSLTEAAVQRASTLLGAASDQYAAATGASGDLDATLTALAQQVAALTGAAAQLPATVALPAPPARVVVAAPAPAAAPATQATTGASGH